MVQPAPVGALRAPKPRYQERWAPSWAAEAVGKWQGLERRVPYQAGSSMSCGAPYSTGAAEEPREACGDPSSSALGLSTHPQLLAILSNFCYCSLPVPNLPDPYPFML